MSFRCLVGRSICEEVKCFLCGNNQSKDRGSLVWRMCMMVSPTQNMLNREELLKKLLHGASPRNPTYILGRILGNFSAQGSTELTVKKGEEVFILFEINEWAFVTVFSNTKRKGYVPLDYCDVVRDFYDSASKSGTLQSHVSHRSNESCIDTASRTPSINRSCTYSRPNTEMTVHISPADSHVRQHHTTLRNVGRYDPNMELYAEVPFNPLSSASAEDHHMENSSCCCRCNRLHTCKGDNYNHVLKYLSQSELMQSGDEVLEGSESGLGDSESVLSSDLMKLPHTQMLADLNDMSTQTSMSLENLYDTLRSLDVSKDDCQAYQALDKYDWFDEIPVRDLPPPPPGYENSPPATYKRQPHHPDLTQQPSLCMSVDSAYSDSVFDSSLATDQTDSELSSPNPRKLSRGILTSAEESEQDTRLTPLRRTVRFQSTGTDSDDEDDEAEFSNVTPTPPPRCSSSLEMRRRLALPILEREKKTNRVELTKLSQRIKDKLKPARAEIIQASKAEPSQQELTTPSDMTGDEADPDFPVIKESKKRQAVLQSIQEQYMKLEEARLLHNALKELNQAMTTTKPSKITTIPMGSQI